MMGSVVFCQTDRLRWRMRPWGAMSGAGIKQWLTQTTVRGWRIQAVNEGVCNVMEGRPYRVTQSFYLMELRCWVLSISADWTASNWTVMRGSTNNYAIHTRIYCPKRSLQPRGVFTKSNNQTSTKHISINSSCSGSNAVVSWCFTGTKTQKPRSTPSPDHYVFPCWVIVWSNNFGEMRRTSYRLYILLWCYSCTYMQVTEWKKEHER